ncbi:hypothetical protein POTOM_018623 [Populus tomentosa]|uniref:Uncharacterized protein n=1 Tax=Populus tomentosa TaxID=118781 RepID=A0A8X8D457_POPTO|nr:hypothetical protein POTOM_018623 [Populus tomentosa]
MGSAFHEKPKSSFFPLFLLIGLKAPNPTISKFDRALKDTYLMSLLLCRDTATNGSLLLRQFSLSLDGPASEWFDNLRPKGLGK